MSGQARSAATVEQRPCPWCKTPGYPDDPYCLYCGRSRAEVDAEEAYGLHDKERLHGC